MRSLVSISVVLLLVVSGCANTTRSNYKPQNLSVENTTILVGDLANTIAANTPAKNTIFEVDSDALSGALGDALKKKGYAVNLASSRSHDANSIAKKLNYTVDWLSADNLYATVIIDNDRYTRAYSMAGGKLTSKGGPIVGVTSHE